MMDAGPLIVEADGECSHVQGTQGLLRVRDAKLVRWAAGWLVNADRNAIFLGDRLGELQHRWILGAGRQTEVPLVVLINGSPAVAWPAIEHLLSQVVAVHALDLESRQHNTSTVVTIDTDLRIHGIARHATILVTVVGASTTASANPKLGA